MFCGNCGNRIDDDSTFCAFCGTQVTPSGSEVVYDTTPVYTPDPVYTGEPVYTPDPAYASESSGPRLRSTMRVNRNKDLPTSDKIKPAEDL